jgi:hypothetical protein
MPGRLRQAASTLAVLFATVALACCVTYSVSPLYDAQTSFFEPALLGTWVDPQSDKPTTITFAKTKTGDNGYDATYYDPDNTPPKTTFYNVHLVKLNGKLFLDAVATGASGASKDDDAAFAKKYHLLARISIEGDRFYFGLIDDNRLQEGFNSGKYSVPHNIVEGDAVLTASTADLQKFVADHADDDQLFPPAEPLVRKK